tara:strand:- start:110 stop:538 length:429 start_codon:yes stop_codon:yes gene_type:complete
MSIIDIKHDYDIVLSLKDIEELNITVQLLDIINIQIWKTKNIIIIDYINSSYNKIDKLFLLLYNDSIIKFEFQNDKINIIIDDINEYSINNQVISPNISYLKTDIEFKNYYVKKENLINYLTIDEYEEQDEGLIKGIDNAFI